MRRIADVGSHTRDVLAFLADSAAKELACALAVVDLVDGSSPRARGAMLAVNADRAYCGYVSNGCVDADVALQAMATTVAGRARRVRYGEGSPYKDVQLPCGGAMELLLIPNPDADAIAAAIDAFDSRAALQVSLASDGAFIVGDAGEQDTLFTHCYAPPMRIAIVGKGAEALALLRLSRAAGCDVHVYSPDADIIEAAADLSIPATPLRSAADLIDLPTDPWSAIALLFHDHDWEAEILARALETDAFYIGAMGSSQTHTRRLDILKSLGVHDNDLSRVRGPIGLFHSARDADALAVSVLAEIFKAFPGEARR
ncbi:MAG: XdhC family protein [Pseudomonadota bacterium]